MLQSDAADKNVMQNEREIYLKNKRRSCSDDGIINCCCIVEETTNHCTYLIPSFPKGVIVSEGIANCLFCQCTGMDYL